MEVSAWLHAPASLARGKDSSTHWLGGWVDPRADLDVAGKRKIFKRDWLKLWKWRIAQCNDISYSATKWNTKWTWIVRSVSVTNDVSFVAVPFTLPRVINPWPCISIRILLIEKCFQWKLQILISPIFYAMHNCSVRWTLSEKIHVFSFCFVWCFVWLSVCN